MARRKQSMIMQKSLQVRSKVYERRARKEVEPVHRDLTAGITV